MLALVVACNSPSGKSKVAPKDVAVVRKDPVVLHMPEPKVDLPHQESFTLLEPGKNPAEPLRYVFAEGTSAQHSTTKLKSRRLSDGNWGPTAELPPITTGFNVTVATGKPIVLEPLAGTTKGPSTDADAYLAPWKVLAGHHFNVPVDARGRLGKIEATDLDLKQNPDALDDLTQRLYFEIVPLPEEAVGPGAMWRAVTLLRQKPVTVKQTATYTLRARTATSWTIDVDIQRIAEEQVVTGPELPPGAAADMLAVSRKLAGTMTVTPSRLVPAGKATVNSMIHMRIATADHHIFEQILEDDGSVELSGR